MPSPCAALTSAPCFSSARTASRSPFIADSATGALELAAPRSTVMHRARPPVSNERRFSISCSITKPPHDETTNQECSRDGRRRRRAQRERSRAVTELLDIVEPQFVQQRQHHVG